MTGLDSLPPIDQALLPADVRNGTKDDRNRYAAALGFERMLVTQLTQQLASTTKPTGDDDEGGSAATSAYRQMLPGALADAVSAGGGLGLARQIADSLKATGA